YVTDVTVFGSLFELESLVCGDASSFSTSSRAGKQPHPGHSEEHLARMCRPRCMVPGLNGGFRPLPCASPPSKMPPKKGRQALRSVALVSRTSTLCSSLLVALVTLPLALTLLSAPSVALSYVSLVSAPAPALRASGSRTVSSALASTTTRPSFLLLSLASLLLTCTFSPFEFVVRSSSPSSALSAVLLLR
ncbi:hypothetical protein E4T42_01874, partial [Aureobasidium subglaciale]